MSTLTINDPFERNKKKLDIVKKITDLLLEHFPKHGICHPSQLRNSTKYFAGDPNVVKDSENNITKVEFGLHTPYPSDNRKRFLGIPIGEVENPSVIAKLVLEFKEINEHLHKATIFVFGIKNKPSLLKFACEFETGKLVKLGGLIYLQVESENERELH